MQAKQPPQVIAGQNAGRRVTLAPAIAPGWKRLEVAAKDGNHWALLAVKHLTALSSGALGKSNVYVRPQGKVQGGNQTYIVFLPGLKATVLGLANSSYYVSELVLDANYFEANNEIRQRTRMGLYRVTPGGEGGWQTKFVEGGNITPQDSRLVAIADAGYGGANAAAREIVPRAMKQPGVPTASVRQQGCDLHFTPGKKRLGGLIRYNSMAIDSSRASALHLAETMFQARNVSGVIWLADQGGSAVVTQAMRILADRDVSLKGHTAYLYKPRTSPGNALLLAHSLKLTVNEAFANTGWDVQGALSQLSVAGARLNNESDPYNRGYHAQSWVNGLVKAAGPVGVASASAAAMGASIPMIAGVVAAISTGGVVYSLGQSLTEDLRHKLKR